MVCCVIKPKPFKLTPPRILESDRQSQIIDWLRVEHAAGRVSWFCRNNGGAVKTATRVIRFYALYAGFGTSSKGKADIDGMLPGGRYFALEVKQPGKKATPEQADFIATVIAGGGIAGVVTGFEDVERILRRDTAETKNPLARVIAPGHNRLITD